MATPFHLQIVTPDGVALDDQVERVVVRTTEGDVGVMHGHTSYLAALVVGRVAVTMLDGSRRIGANSNGYISVVKDGTRLVVNAFEWADDIDLERAQKAKARAEAVLSGQSEEYDVQTARVRLLRAVNRIRIGSDR